MRFYVSFFLCFLFASFSPIYGQKAGQQIESQIIAVEHRYWDAWKNKDAKTLAQLRADDFQEADQDGVWDKKQAEQGEIDMEITSYKLWNEKVSVLQPGVALLTSEVAYTSSYKGADDSSPHSYVAWLFVLRDGNWRVLYSQDSAAKVSGEMAAVSEQEMSAQALAKEKEILETVKRNDWGAFSSLMAEDAIAINEDGIIGKKELIDGIKTAGTIFSDYKMENVKVIPQRTGAIVAYRETLVGTQNGKPFTWHIYTHSHWERRGGKWLMTMFQDSMAKE